MLLSHEAALLLAEAVEVTQATSPAQEDMEATAS